MAKLKLMGANSSYKAMYDIAEQANNGIIFIRDEQFYRQVIEHHRTFIGLRGFDYENMRLHMIYGESVSFDNLIEELAKLNAVINKLK